MRRGASASLHIIVPPPFYFEFGAVKNTMLQKSGVAHFFAIRRKKKLQRDASTSLHIFAKIAHLRHLSTPSSPPSFLFSKSVCGFQGKRAFFPLPTGGKRKTGLFSRVNGIKGMTSEQWKQFGVENLAQSFLFS